MSKQTPFTDIAALEQELAELAPLVRQGFREAGGPSPRVEEAIRREALAQAERGRSRFEWPVYRTFAAAAGFALLLGVAAQLHLAHRAGHNALAVNHLPAIGATQQASAETHVDGPTGLANRLLDIQGLDEEGFFKAEGEEPLWL